MGERQSVRPAVPDPAAVSASLAELAQAGERLMVDSVQRQFRGDGPTVSDDVGMGKAFLALSTRLATQPLHLAEQQLNLTRDFIGLWQGALTQMLGGAPRPVVRPEAHDRRFRDDAWDECPWFDFIKQAYLIAARGIQDTVEGIQGLDEQTARKVSFYTRQFVDALAPTNFVATNPEVLRECVETGGQSLLDGLRNLMQDLERGGGRLDIRMTDLEAFELGKNVAVTPGKVVYQNEMMQLVQYAPSGGDVLRRPLLIVPPWINKFYILDLRPRNSFIKWAVDQGHTVFVISWVNPTEAYADTGFEDYLTGGPLAALDAIEQATGEREVNGLGYCLGGTLLATTLAYLAARGEERIRSATFFTTLLDFAQPGELEVFLDDEQISALERRMNRSGYLDGAEMATTFSMLRANDLIWSFVVNNYLLGKEPFPFDLLYWNSDSTRMPARMHSFYLRNMYQRNLLREPGGLRLAGEGIDLGRVTVPTYFLSAMEDHIAPWQSTYAGSRLFANPARFVLGGSGHIAGVINPPAAAKYGYWINAEAKPDAEAWLQGAHQHPGSWWPDWQAWVQVLDPARVPARVPGDGALEVLEDAPGSYVKYRLTG